MTIFLRLLADQDKASALQASCASLRSNSPDARAFQVPPKSFRTVPGAPFAYWVSDAVRGIFKKFEPFESEGRSARQGLATANDARFLRCWWEVNLHHETYVNEWPSFAKGGVCSLFYGEISLVIKWAGSGRELKESVIIQYGNAGKRVYNEGYYFRPAITWPLRTSRFSPQLLPGGSIFSVRGYTAHTPRQEMSSLALFASHAFDYVFKTALGRYSHPEFIVGVLQKLPWPQFDHSVGLSLEKLSQRGWSIKRGIKLSDETSRVFQLPILLLIAKSDPVNEEDLNEIQAKIDDIAFDLYGFNSADRASALMSPVVEVREYSPDDADTKIEEDEDESEVSIDQIDSLLSWAVGVAFGRFDWRLATGEREAPREPDPFDPLPAKSPGMLPDGAAPFHAHAGILVTIPATRMTSPI